MSQRQDHWEMGRLIEQRDNLLDRVKDMEKVEIDNAALRMWIWNISKGLGSTPKNQSQSAEDLLKNHDCGAELLRELTHLRTDNTQLRKMDNKNRAEMDRLKSELEKANADGAVMRGALEWIKGISRTRSDIKFDDQLRELHFKCDEALSTDAGRDLLSRYREAVKLLREAAEEEQRRDWLERRDTLLATVKGGPM